MPSFNCVILLGRLAKDSEVKYTPSGTMILSSTIVVNNSRKKGNDWEDNPCFIDFTAFGKVAESYQDKLHKGIEILIEGRLEQDKWETPEGQKRSKHKLIVDKIRMIASKKESNLIGGGETFQGEEYDNSDLPF